MARTRQLWTIVSVLLAAIVTWSVLSVLRLEVPAAAPVIAAALASLFFVSTLLRKK